MISYNRKILNYSFNKTETQRKLNTRKEKLITNMAKRAIQKSSAIL